MIISGKTDLITRFPEIAAEWDYEKNEGIDPSCISPYSSEKVYWKCKKGHIWRAIISSRVSHNSKCPFCVNNRITVGVNDFATLCPNIACEWDYKKNVGMDPSDFSRTSLKKVWWICSKCGYEWSQAIGVRTRDNHPCPICTKKEALEKRNTPESGASFLDKYPTVAKEWNIEKNEKKPQEYLPHSHTKVWWKCSICNHEWQATIASRTYNHTGCPECAKELQVSFPEKAIFYYVKQYNNKEEVIENYKIPIKTAHKPEIDIFIPSRKIGIEYDGERWHRIVQKDQRKDEVCIENGITLIRVREPKCVKYDYGITVVELDSLSEKSLEEGIKKVLCLCFGSQNNYNVSISRDRTQIYNYINFQKKENSLFRLFPQVTLDWNYERNGVLQPELVNAKSGRLVWWKCHICNYEWESKISNRTSKGTTGCPKCNGKIVTIGVDDFATLRPDLLKEWDYEKNHISPQQIALNSHKKIWWKCNKGHSWQTTANARINGKTNCPFCSRIMSGYKQSVAEETNSLKMLYPEVALDWDYESNLLYSPETIIATSGRRVQWKCHKCGGVWKAVIRDRTIQANGCPYCNGKRAISGVTDLNTKYPDIAKEWDYNKNEQIHPTEVTASSAKSVWWICKNGHGFFAQISTRTSMHTGCPYCSGKRAIPGETDFFTLFPEVAIDWNYNRNEIDPNRLRPGSNKIVWWKCHECGKEWQAMVCERCKGHKRCPDCNK